MNLPFLGRQSNKELSFTNWLKYFVVFIGGIIPLDFSSKGNIALKSPPNKTYFLLDYDDNKQIIT